MKTATSDRAAAIFLALSQVPPDAWEGVLTERCGSDAALRLEVERLLEGLNRPDTVLPSPDALLPPPADVAVHSAGTAVGDFIVVRQIGSGGTGVVYLAHQQHPARVVALKVLRREFIASTVQRRFELEAELLGQLQHPGIAQVYAAHPGDEQTPPYIAMELVNGPPLTEFADIRGLSVRDRIELVAMACDAVQHAHQRGVIHRDLKPANILVNEEGQPKVLDFGVARATGTDLSLTTIETQTGQLVGTLPYMSPEQVAAVPNAIDTRTDIHALGVILFRLLAGRLPFGHDEPPMPELARRIIHDDAPRLGTVNPALRGDLEVIVARALAKDRERRYASAAGLAADLRRYLSGQPISASADSAWYVVRRQLRRYQQALYVSAAVVVALAGLAVYANLQRATANLANAQLEDSLSTSTIERGRLLSVTGNLPIAEELVWRELFRRPDSRHAQWALWDIYSREPSVWARRFHDGGTLTLRFSPDNRYLLTIGQADGLMRLVAVESGEVVRTFAATPATGTRRAFFVPDGTAVVSGSKDGTLRIWDVATGQLRREFRGVVQSLDDLAIAGGGAYAATVSGGGALQVWSLATGERTIDFSEMAGRTVVVSADPAGTVLLAGGFDGSVTALDLTHRRRLWQSRGHQGQTISVALAPGNLLAASGGLDGYLHVWNTATGERLHAINTENGSVRNVTFDQSGTLVAEAGQWRTRLWDLNEPSRPPRDFGSAEGMTDLHIRPDRRFLATCHGGWGLVRLWDLAADSRPGHWIGHAGAVSALAISAEGPTVVSGGADGSLSIWPLERERRRLSVKADGRIGAIVVSEDKRWIVTTGYPGTASIWDAHDGRRVADLPEVHSSRAAVFADGGRRLVIGDIDGVLWIWDWSEGTARNPRKVISHNSEVLSLASHDSRLFVAHRETLVVIRDVTTGAELRRLQPTASPFSIAVTPDGRLVAAGTWPGIVDIWELATGRKVQELKGPTALVTGLDFSANGDLLALSSRDGSTRLWDVRSNQWLATVAARKPGAERARFLPGGRHLAIGYADGEVEVRDLQYFFRHAAGHAEYQLRLAQERGESFPRSAEALAWARRMLSSPSNRLE